jgi:hypothetical protein
VGKMSFMEKSTTVQFCGEGARGLFIWCRILEAF